MHGEKKPPISSDAYAAKQATVAELQLVLSQLQVRIAARHRNFSVAEQAEEFRSLVTENPCPYLNANPESWATFLRDRGGLLDSFDHPAALFDEWLAFWTKREPEQVRQKISRLKIS